MLPQKAEWPGLSGFWNSINGADFDQDGDIDYIVGNFGENTDLKASEDEPLTIVAKDFDKNGKIDPIIGSYVNGVNYPLPTRDALISQISAMKKKFPYYKDYGRTTFDHLFTEKQLKGAIHKEVTCLKTLYLENRGDGKFSYKTLPPIAQMAPVYGIAIADLDDDGFLDIMLTGNRTDTETLGGSMNSSKGRVLLGNEKGDFKNVPMDVSGFVTPGDSRGIAQLARDNGIDFLVANNNGAVQSFTVKSYRQTLALKPTDTYAEIQLVNGKTYRQEFYWGSGYLTQNSRTWRVPNHATKITIFSSQKGTRNAMKRMAIE